MYEVFNYIAAEACVQMLLKIALIPGSGTFGMESIIRQYVIIRGSTGDVEGSAESPSPPPPPLIISTTNGHFGQRWVRNHKT